MARILLVTLIAVAPALFGVSPASACHPPPLPDLGCPHCLAEVGPPFDRPPFTQPPFCPMPPAP